MEHFSSLGIGSFVLVRVTPLFLSLSTTDSFLANEIIINSQTFGSQSALSMIVRLSQVSLYFH